MKVPVVCMVIVCVFAGCAAPPKNPAKQEAKARWEQMRAKVKLQLAERNFDGGQIDDALKICQEVLALDPNSLDGHLLMARIQLEKGQAAAAEAAMDAASGLGQNVPELAYLRGMLAERREQMADATQWYKSAYEAKPNEAEYLTAYVESLLAADCIDPALDLLRERERDFEQDVRVQILVGQAYAMRGQYRQAGDAYLSVLRLTPTDPRLREEAGLTLLAAKRLDEAQAVLEPLLTSTKEKPSPALIQAFTGALLAANQASRALTLLEPAAIAHPESFAIHMLLIKAYLGVDKPQPAQDAARKACRLKPESVEARLLLAYCAVVTGDREQAIATTQAIVAANPDDAEALALLERAFQLKAPATIER